jgi:hypothetical protein
MRNKIFAVLCATLISLAAAELAFAQSDALTLKMSRDWGYGGINGDIQGLFSMHITGPGNVDRVKFYIDNTKIGELDKVPFNMQFNTDNYQLGIHKIYAVGYSASGQIYQSNVISANFVTKQNTMKFMLPVLAVVLLVTLISALAPVLINRRKRTITPMGSERNYGSNGGTICPKCHRPFALPLVSMHLGFSKLTACPYCGKWSLVRRESIDKLRQAQKNELGMPQYSKQVRGQTEQEKEHKELDDSKYQDE